MTFDALRAAIRPPCNVAGLILVIIAALKLGGIHFGVPGDVSQLALVGIGLLHV